MATRYLTLADDAGMPTIGLLADKLLDTLAPGSVVRLDLSAVAHPHLCVIQLVTAARHHAARIDADFALATPASAGLADMLTRAGFLTGTPDDTAFWLHGDIAQ